MTLLHRAAANGDADMVDLLLVNGVSPNLTDALGRTALHWACREGKTECARLLIEASATVDVRATDDQVEYDVLVAVAEASVSGDLASAVRDFIAGEEKTLQEGLELMYANMTDETFKAMRRVMPVHRNKMTWNINEVKSRMQLGKK